MTVERPPLPMSPAASPAAAARSLSARRYPGRQEVEGCSQKCRLQSPDRVRCQVGVGSTSSATAPTAVEHHSAAVGNTAPASRTCGPDAANRRPSGPGPSAPGQIRAVGVAKWPAAIPMAFSVRPGGRGKSTVSPRPAVFQLPGHGVGDPCDAPDVPLVQPEVEQRQPDRRVPWRGRSRQVGGKIRQGTELAAEGVAHGAMVAGASVPTHNALSLNAIKSAMLSHFLEESERASPKTALSRERPGSASPAREPLRTGLRASDG